MGLSSIYSKTVGILRWKTLVSELKGLVVTVHAPQIPAILTVRYLTHYFPLQVFVQWVVDRGPFLRFIKNTCFYGKTDTTDLWDWFRELFLHKQIPWTGKAEAKKREIYPTRLDAHLYYFMILLFDRTRGRGPGGRRGVRVSLCPGCIQKSSCHSLVIPLYIWWFYKSPSWMDLSFLRLFMLIS